MSWFKLDTSGVVPEQLARQMHDMRWIDLSPFEQGYTAALLESVAVENVDALFGLYADGRRYPGFSNLAPETLEQIMKDCASANDGKWLGYRNTEGCGAVFWKERQQGSLNGDEPRFPPQSPTLADDGLIYLRAKL
jgi:hypothetical protein